MSALGAGVRDGGVDFGRPGIDASAQRLRLLEALVAQPGGDVERTLTMMAQDHEALVGVELLVGARGDVAHGHQYTAGNARGLKFPRFAYVDEPRLAFAKKS